MSRRDLVMKMFLRYKEETEERVTLGVEQNKKGSVTLTVRDKNGNPLPGVKVRARLKKHEFLHGANLFMLDEFESAEKNAIYRETFPKLFNAATLPFYWDALEPEEGKPRFAKDSPKIYRRPAPDLCLEYCDEHNITPKEHCLTYMNFAPAWVDQMDTADVMRKLERRYATVAGRYAGRIHGWEVINELFCTDAPKRRTPFFTGDEILDWSFRMAEKYFPCNELIINEASFVWDWIHFAYKRSGYYQMIEQGLRRGLRIDAVGMQFHMFNKREDEHRYLASRFNPRSLFEVLDTYATLGKPIQITEITIPAYSNSADDEAAQADLIEQLYSVWFSHPATEAAIYWNLPDGYAAFAPQGDMTSGENVYYGGLLRFDMSKKPAAERLEYLFGEKWHTDVTCETDGEGVARFRGFYGTYEVTVGGKTYEIRTSKKRFNDLNLTVD